MQDGPNLSQSGLSRRHFVGGCVAAVAGSSLATATMWPGIQEQSENAGPRPGQQSDKGEKPPAELVNEAAQQAIDRGLMYLARRQINTGPNGGAFGSSGYSCGVAVCSLGGLAMMCGGSAPGEGLYGKQVDRCVDFVMSQVRDTGYIARKDNAANENMYGHGFSTLFLAEAYGMTQKTEIGEKLKKAVALTVNSQNSQGGWRYQPAKVPDADLSVTVCQIMGLRAARDAGVHVPDEVRTRCIEYVKKSQNDNGSFRYQMSGGHSTFPMTAAGVTSLYSAGIYDSEPVKKGLANLLLHKPGGHGAGSHYFYGHYYAVQAMWHAGGDHWNQWYPAIRDELIRNQATDGSWASSYAGPEYGTAMACIILQIPLNFLPVFSP